MGTAGWRVAAFVCALASLVFLPGTPAQAQSLDLSLRETIPIPAGETVWFVQDLDGDAVLDILTFNNPAHRFTIWERSGGTFVAKFSFDTGDYYSGFAVGDLDGDGLPEISVKTSFAGNFRIFESTGNDAYAQRFYKFLGPYPESTSTGDSDGDGNLEFLVARETFPSMVHRFEAVADNTYVELPPFMGRGGNCYFGGTADLDGDGAIETVFSDDYYWDFSGYLLRGYGYVFENGVQVYEDPSHKMLVRSLGDTDGNGLGEIVGLPSLQSSPGVWSDVVKVLESTGSGDDFVEVFNASTDYWFYVFDFDADGQEEFFRMIDSGSGQRDVFTLAHRSGSLISDFYSSGTLLQGFAGNISWMWPNEDTNGDGNPEIVVVQGANLHILEVEPPCSLQGLIEAIDAAGLSFGTERSLTAKVEAAVASIGRGDYETASNQLGAFMNQVAALRGKKIDADLADELFTMAGCIAGAFPE